jgi:hypothetical protein
MRLTAPFDGLRAIGTWFDELTTGAVRKEETDCRGNRWLPFPKFVANRKDIYLWI